MAIERRPGVNGRPQYRVRVASPDPETGRRRNLTVGTFATKRAAEAAERAAIVQRDRGTLLDPSTVTVAELLADWLASVKGDVQPNTFADYAGTVRLHLVPALGSVRAQSLTAAIIQRVYDGWRDAGIGARTIRGAHLRLSAALERAARLRLVPVNVCRDARPPKLTTGTPSVWDAAQAGRFLAVAKPDGLAPLWSLLLREGMRKGEALGLRWCDLDLDRGLARITQTVVAAKGDKGRAVVQRRTKTAAGSRTVRLLPETVAELRDHRSRWLAKRLAAPEWADLDLVVCTAAGQPVNPGGNVSRSLDRLAALAGVPRLTVHALRHTHATLLLLSGAPVKAVAERLGHAGITITLDTYGHVLPEMQGSAVAALSALLSAAEPPSASA